MTANRFFKVVNNMAFCSDGSIEQIATQTEIIPLENLVKVLRWVHDREWIICYVWKCPVRKKQVKYYELFTFSSDYEEKLKNIERFLCGVVL